MAVGKTDRVTDLLRYSKVGKMETERGKQIRMRLAASEAYYQKHSRNWEYLQQLYTNVFETFKEGMVWSTTLAIGWAVMNSLVDDVYFQNPQSWLEARSGDPTGELSKEVRDVTNTVHEDADTEGIIRQAMQSSTWAGFGGHWVWFEQEDSDDPENPESQTIRAEYVSPFKLRFDPLGRKWNLSDHKYIIRLYSRSLQFFLDAPWVPQDRKEMLRAWGVRQQYDLWNNANYAAVETNNGEEQDPRYFDIQVAEFWSLAEGVIAHVPVGADFDIGEYPMPPHFVKGKTYPLTLVAFNRNPENKECTTGFYPKPDLELIQGPLEAINRLNDLYLDAATLSVLKYLTVAGLIAPEEADKIKNDKNRELIPVDLTAWLEFLREAFPGQQIDQNVVFNLRNLVMLLPQEERAALVKHQEAIEYQLNIIANIMKMGPLSRYGIATAKSATESAGIQGARDQGLQTRSNQAGRIYNEVTRKIWLMLKSQQVLPIPYRSSTEQDPGIWREFHVSKIWNIDLSFRHRVGSNRPRDTQTEMFLRKEAATILLPLYQNMGDTSAVIAITKWMLEPYDFRGIQVFNDQRAAIARELLELQIAIQSRKIEVTPQVSARRGELTSQLINACLGRGDKEKVAAAIGRGGPGAEVKQIDEGGSGGGDQGSLPAATTPGQQAFKAGAAGAGMTNIGG